MRAVAVLGAGRDRREVAELLGVTVESVTDWWAAWQTGGREALVSKTRGRRVGEHQVLDPDQQQCVRQALIDHRPEDLGPSPAVVDTRSGCHAASVGSVR